MRAIRVSSTFLSRCAPDAPVVLGDARLTLEASPDRYDLIVLDAFSSDTIPVHLLTREAFAGYLSKLSPHGVIVAHISNRHLDLAPVVANVAQSQGLVTFLREDDSAGDLMTTFNANARLVVMAREASRCRKRCGNLDAAASGPVKRAVDRRLFQHPRRHAAHEIWRLARISHTAN